MNSLTPKLFLYILLVCALLFPTLAQAEFQVPTAPDTYVLDQANILSQETESALIQSATTLQSESTSQIAVITLDSLQGYPIETASLETARKWGVGQDTSNNGILVLIAPNEREVRIEVGYGLEGVVTDAESSWIIRNLMIPTMREGDYDSAILLAFERLVALVKQEVFPHEPSDDKDFATTVAMALWLFIIFGGVLGSVLSGTKSWWLGGVIGAIAGAFVSVWIGVLIGGLLGLGSDFILSTFFYQKFNMVDKSGRSRWRSGGGGFGSGGGGFGGFGGGGFGGGGASGRW